MKKSAAIFLFLLGGVEVFYGIVWGRMRIYAHEKPFAMALKLQELSPSQQKAHNYYIDLFQDQWHIVAVFGVLTFAVAVVLLVADKKKE